MVPCIILEQYINCLYPMSKTYGVCAELDVNAFTVHLGQAWDRLIFSPIPSLTLALLSVKILYICLCYVYLFTFLQFS